VWIGTKDVRSNTGFSEEEGHGVDAGEEFSLKMEKKCEQTGLEPLRLGLRVWIQKQIEILDPMMQATRGLMTLIKQKLNPEP